MNQISPRNGIPFQSHECPQTLVGAGVITRWYLAAIADRTDAALRAVCDINPESLAPFAGSAVATSVNLHDIILRQDVDAVIVNVPNDHHYQVCAKLLDGGKHVCCEKPLTLDLAEAEELNAIAARNGRVLFTAFHRRYNRNIDLLRARVCGVPLRSLRVRYFEDIRQHCGPDAWYLDPVRCGGGVVADNGPNALDLLRLFVGPIEITSAWVERDCRNVDIWARIEARAVESGVAATVLLDWGYGNGELKDVALVTAGGEIGAADMLHGFPEFKSSLGHEYVRVLEDFLHRIAHRRAPGSMDPDGIEMTRLIAQVYAQADRAPLERRQ